MGKRFDSLLFPGYRRKAFTLSYDDGVVQDRRLVKLMNDHHIKGTFNLNCGVLGHEEVISPPNGKSLDISKISKEEVPVLYEGQEVGGHGLYHSDLSSLAAPHATYEITEDKAGLEALVRKPLSMFAYPFGLFSGELKQLLKQAGYKGARTIRSSYSFELPKDPLELDPTCHHNDERLMELAKEFVEKPAFKAQMFYVWGHAYEFDHDENWDRMEKFLAYMDGHGDIWYATNSEILAYIEACKMLEYSTDGSLVYNPTCTDIYLMTSFETSECLKAGEITELKETRL
ncbi:MAG: polysaccharide deacetylase family protein [Erysipelotrichaceae bacterium]|nr:polysaccharide deacetylase family protein [Erysipelotrichaceae bacterium]